MNRLFVLFCLAVITAMASVGFHADSHAATATERAETAYLIIDFHVAEDRLDDFLPIMTGINAGMAGEEGFVNAIVYRNIDDPLAFTLVEEWESRALHRAHYDRIVESGDWANILGMLTEEPTLRYTSKL